MLFYFIKLIRKDKIYAICDIKLHIILLLDSMEKYTMEQKKKKKKDSGRLGIFDTWQTRFSRILT